MVREGQERRPVRAGRQEQLRLATPRRPRDQAPPSARRAPLSAHQAGGCFRPFAEAVVELRAAGSPRRAQPSPRFQPAFASRLAAEASASALESQMSGLPLAVGAHGGGRGRCEGSSWVWPIAPAQEPRSGRGRRAASAATIFRQASSSVSAQACAADPRPPASPGSAPRPCRPGWRRSPIPCPRSRSGCRRARHRSRGSRRAAATPSRLRLAEPDDAGRHLALHVVADRQGELRLAGVVSQHARIGGEAAQHRGELRGRPAGRRLAAVEAVQPGEEGASPTAPSSCDGARLGGGERMGAPRRPARASERGGDSCGGG